MKKETLTVETNSNGTTTYRNASDQRHNPNGPAVVDTDGSKWYYINGKLHNPNGAAVIWPDGGQEYWINDQLHNPDGPAMVRANGYKAHYIKGKKLTEAEFTAWQAQQSPPLHNKTATIDGIEYTIKRNNIKKEKLKVYTEQGGTITYRNAEGQRHNPDGPAVVDTDGSKLYLINGKLHNPNGAAVIWPDGYKNYFINDKELTEAEFKAWQAQQAAK